MSCFPSSFSFMIFYCSLTTSCYPFWDELYRLKDLTDITSLIIHCKHFRNEELIASFRLYIFTVCFRCFELFYKRLLCIELCISLSFRAYHFVVSSWLSIDVMNYVVWFFLNCNFHKAILVLLKFLYCNSSLIYLFTSLKLIT